MQTWLGVLLVALLKFASEPVHEEQAMASIPWANANGHLAIVIDDVGRDMDELEALLSLEIPLTFSILPDAPYTAQAQHRLASLPATRATLLAHIPMEPLDAQEMSMGLEPREVFLTTHDSLPMLRSKLQRALQRVPVAAGINNHMGSRLTADRAAMQTLMDVLSDQNLLFLDSRTNAATQADMAAADAGLLHGSRHVFLDNSLIEADIEAALLSAVERSHTEPCIAIGHPSPQLTSVLRTWTPKLKAQAIGLYPLKQLLSSNTTPSDPLAR